MNTLKQLVIQDEEPRSFWEILIWWEVRRVPYNLIVGISGLAVLGLLTFAHPMLFHQDVLIGVLFYGLAANFFYTGGWIAEYILRASLPYNPAIRYLGSLLFVSGLVMSVLLNFLIGSLIEWSFWYNSF
jgi:hypothetical protein